MHLPPIAHLAARRPALSCLAAALMAASPAARAGIEITQLDPFADGILPVIRSAPLDPWPALNGSGQLSAVRFYERRLSRLVDPAQGQPVLQDLLADSGWKSTTVAGQAIGAFASIDLIEVSGGVPTPALARSAVFESHVQAHTGRHLRMENDVPVIVGGVQYAPQQLYRYGSSNAAAESAWFDTWLAQQSAAATLTMRLDGSFGHAPFCPSADCGVAVPAGITSVLSQRPGMGFDANFTVLDLDTQVYCDDPDECRGPPERPRAVAMVRVRYVEESNATFPQVWDLPLTMSFQAQAGHRYLAIGTMQADAFNGGQVSFYNSFRLTGVQAPAGALLSSALGDADLAGHFAQPVPEPGTLALWAAGVLVLWRQRRRQDSAA